MSLRSTGFSCWILSSDCCNSNISEYLKRILGIEEYKAYESEIVIRICKLSSRVKQQTMNVAFLFVRRQIDLALSLWVSRCMQSWGRMGQGRAHCQRHSFSTQRFFNAFVVCMEWTLEFF